MFDNSMMFSSASKLLLCAGSAPRARKRLRLPTLAEEPQKERAAQQDVTNRKALVGLQDSESAAEKNDQADTRLHPSLASARARHEDKKV